MELQTVFLRGRFLLVTTSSQLVFLFESAQLVDPGSRTGGDRSVCLFDQSRASPSFTIRDLSTSIYFLYKQPSWISSVGLVVSH